MGREWRQLTIGYVLNVETEIQQLDIVTGVSLHVLDRKKMSRRKKMCVKKRYMVYVCVQ